MQLYLSKISAPTNSRFTGEFSMQSLTQMPLLFGAIQYSLAYLLCGGGVVGAIGVYIVAKVLRK